MRPGAGEGPPNSVRLARAMTGFRKAAALANRVSTMPPSGGAVGRRASVPPPGRDAGAESTEAEPATEGAEAAYEYFARCVAVLGRE
jgi:hypothetical protein